MEISELSLAKVLRCGQTFRWKNINNVWSFAIQDRIVLLKQDDQRIQYSHIMLENSPLKSQKIQDQETFKFVQDYFNLSINLKDLYTHWTEQHLIHRKGKNSNSPFQAFTGIRILRQDPWETLISFICSSNNNVKRISKMCDNLCLEYGEYINEYEGMKFYSFPAPESLTEDNVELRLRELGFGYRAKYIHQTACKLQDNKDLSVEKLNDLRNQDYQTSHEFLLQLTGVGPKVADCICLMALDKHDVVPVDTHVYQIAVRDYKFKGKGDLKSMTKVIYGAIRLYFKDVFGEYAGWAQSVLFAADLSDLNNGVNISEVESTIKGESTKVKGSKITIKIEDKVKTEIEIKTEELPEIKTEDKLNITENGRTKRIRSESIKLPVSKKIKVEC